MKKKILYSFSLFAAILALAWFTNFSEADAAPGHNSFLMDHICVRVNGNYVSGANVVICNIFNGTTSSDGCAQDGSVDALNGKYGVYASYGSYSNTVAHVFSSSSVDQITIDLISPGPSNDCKNW